MVAVSKIFQVVIRSKRIRLQFYTRPHSGPGNFVAKISLLQYISAYRYSDPPMELRRLKAL